MHPNPADRAPRPLLTHDASTRGGEAFVAFGGWRAHASAQLRETDRDRAARESVDLALALRLSDLIAASAAERGHAAASAAARTELSQNPQTSPNRADSVA